MKIIGWGCGKVDRSYCGGGWKGSKLEKKYEGRIEVEGIVGCEMKWYDELEDLVWEYVKEEDGDEDDDDKWKKKKKKGVEKED